MFRRECFGEAALDDDTIAQMVYLTQQVFIVVERELQLTGFWESIPARKKLEAEIQNGIFLSPAFIKIPHLVKNREQIISRVMELAKKNNDQILYAE